MQPEKDENHEGSEHTGENSEDRKRRERGEAHPTSVGKQIKDANEKALHPGIPKPSISKGGDEGIDDKQPNQ